MFINIVVTTNTLVTKQNLKSASTRDYLFHDIRDTTGAMTTICSPSPPPLQRNYQVFHFPAIFKGPVAIRTPNVVRNVRRIRHSCVCIPRASAEENESAIDSQINETMTNSSSDVKVEVSSSVMRVLEGKDKQGLSLIDAHEQRRKARMDAVIREKSLEIIQASKADEDQFLIPKHDDIYPFIVALFGPVSRFLEVSADAKEFFDRLSDASRIQKSVEEDVAHMQDILFFASWLFFDMNGRILNEEGSIEFERQFLLSMYTKFNLWLKEPSPDVNRALERAYNIYSSMAEYEGLPERVFNGTGFEANRYFDTRYGRMYVGKFSGNAKLFLEEAQYRLNRQYGGLCPLILKGSQDNEEMGCLVARSSSIIFVSWPKFIEVPIFYIFVAGIAFWCQDFSHADPGLESGFLWQKYVIPLGLLGVLGSGTLMRSVLAALYKVPYSVTSPSAFPLPNYGAFPLFSSYNCCLPSRTCLFDLAAAGSVTTLSLSALSLTAAIVFQNLPWKLATTVADFHGCFLVHSDFFAYSQLLTWALNKLSLASLAAESGGVDLVLSPVALVGLLGLNFSLIGLLPMTVFDGGRIMAAVFGRSSQRIASKIVFLLLTISLFSKNFLLGVTWLGIYFVMPDQPLMQDEVSEPDNIRKVVGVFLSLVSMASFIPII